MHRNRYYIIYRVKWHYMSEKMQATPARTPSSTPHPRYTLEQKLCFVECMDAYVQLLLSIAGGILNKKGHYILVMEVCKRHYQNNPITIREAHRVMRQEGKPAHDRIDALEKDGYFIRKRHALDRRKIVLIPTAKLEQIFESITSGGLDIILHAGECIRSIERPNIKS